MSERDEREEFGPVRGDAAVDGPVGESETLTVPVRADALPENKEAVRQTLAEIKSAQNAEKAPTKREVKDSILLLVKILFFPITLIVMGVRFLFKKFRVGITVKTTVVFTVVFGVMIIGYAAFILASLDSLVDGTVTADYMRRLVITSTVLVALFIVLGATLGGFSSQYMINPVRKITKRVKQISDENISSARLEPVDTQDELMELTNQINAMLDSLQEAFERQENFVSDASHELKTPLSVIAGYANLLRRWGKDDPKILDESVEAISREAENMKRIVEQLLWLAKLGKFTLNNTEFNLYETVDGIVDGYKMVNLRHALSLSGDPSITLNADKNLITEAVRTLVDNAIKYTPPEAGEIAISVNNVDEHIEIAVADNGIGIAKEDREHIFERFYRCDKVRSRAAGSSGLGLTICKQIVEMMGGKIRVDSELGEGSTFTIELY
ncbi:MAG: HAMP domain-containing histidine kinase [Clostridiales bacterium]|nr:HAMP domain-containing histidine kinase [Clostridiales bacterium]